MKTFKQFLKEAKQLKEDSSKYKPGEFGYEWTVIKGSEDLEGKVYKGDLEIYNNQKITSLRGCPKEVTGSLKCQNIGITSLEGCPEKVGRNFYCDENKLTSLKGGPKEVKGEYSCSENKLTSLEGAPEKVAAFNCAGNRLKDLKGAPKEITGWDFICCDNPLVSLEGLPRKIERNLELPDIKSFGGEDAINKLSQIDGDIKKNSIYR